MFVTIRYTYERWGSIAVDFAIELRICSNFPINFDLINWSAFFFTKLSTQLVYFFIKYSHLQKRGPITLAKKREREREFQPPGIVLSILSSKIQPFFFCIISVFLFSPFFLDTAVKTHTPWLKHMSLLLVWSHRQINHY